MKVPISCGLGAGGRGGSCGADGAGVGALFGFSVERVMTRSHYTTRLIRERREK